MLSQTSTATSTVAQSMDTAAKAMAAVGKANDPMAMQRVMQQFQRENAKMDMAGEMMDDALDSAFDTDEMEDETDDVMNEVSSVAPQRACWWVLVTHRGDSLAVAGLGFHWGGSQCSARQRTKDKGAS